MLQNHQEHKITVKGEYRIAQVISELALSKNDELEVYEVDKWFDCGRVSVLLEANSYFLEKMSKQTSSIKHLEDCIIIPPCYVSKNAKVSKSIIGPNVSIEEGCVIESSVVSNSIISKRTTIENMHLHYSLISHDARIIGTPKKVNIGEKCEVEFK